MRVVMKELGERGGGGGSYDMYRLYAVNYFIR